MDGTPTLASGARVRPPGGHGETPDASGGQVLLGLSSIIISVIAVAFAVTVVLGHFHVVRVVSGSMRPTLQVGDLELVQMRPTSSIRPGQVVLLPEPHSGALYSHRLMSVQVRSEGVAVRTKGDANPVEDRWAVLVTSTSVPVLVSAIPFSAVPFFALSASVKIVLWLLLLALVASLFVKPAKPARRVVATDTLARPGSCEP